MELPKQFNHWVKSAKLKPTYSDRKYGIFYLKGNGRYWRINCNGDIDVTESYEKFDRYANSTLFSVQFTPKTKGEFIEFIKINSRAAEHFEEKMSFEERYDFDVAVLQLSYN